eukprot:CAMPEP_0179275932 /NCGR_PEP_ID=MMETSP0797-20121207/34318_1 /TAXON_ID=47934 /ORGANISM="Dinophysis acuminata, Strain DAEP01" /LENGTH=212 /DNA_ID=CAMNT_0020984475 /DNA_START=167 /DNA_END=802 /DNA_ORIENTATION=-
MLRAPAGGSTSARLLVGPNSRAVRAPPLVPDPVRAGGQPLLEALQDPQLLLDPGRVLLVAEQQARAALRLLVPQQRAPGRGAVPGAGRRRRSRGVALLELALDGVGLAPEARRAQRHLPGDARLQEVPVAEEARAREEEGLDVPVVAQEVPQLLVDLLRRQPRAPPLALRRRARVDRGVGRLVQQARAGARALRRGHGGGAGALGRGRGLGD